MLKKFMLVTIIIVDVVVRPSRVPLKPTAISELMKYVPAASLTVGIPVSIAASSAH